MSAHERLDNVMGILRTHDLSIAITKGDESFSKCILNVKNASKLI